METPSKNSRRRVTRRFALKIKAIVGSDALVCVYCDGKLCRMRSKKHNKNGLTVDHFIPVSKGGLNASENLFVCCWKCNKEKGDLNPETDLTFWTEFLPSKIGIILC